MKKFYALLILLGMLYTNQAVAEVPAEAMQKSEEALGQCMQLLADGNPDEAGTVCKSGLEALGTESHPIQTAFYQYLSVIASTQNNYQQAEDYAQKNLDATLKFGGDNTVAYAWALTQKGMAMAEQNKYAEAEPVLKKASDLLQTAVATPDGPMPLTEYQYAYQYFNIALAGQDKLPAVMKGMDMLLFQRGVEKPTEADRQLGLANLDIQVGDAYYRNQNMPLAKKYYETANQLYEDNKTKGAATKIIPADVLSTSQTRLAELNGKQ